MPSIRIDSLEEPHLAPYRDLKRSNKTRWAGLFVCEGQLLVERLLASDYEVDSVLLDERYVAVMAERIPSDVPVYVVPDGMVESIVGFKFHRGVIACGRRRASPALTDVLRADAERLTIVVCPQAHDPENLGGVLRNCAAFGVDAVVLGPQGADPFSRRVLRVSMGTVLTLPLVQSTDLAADVQRLRDEWGVQLVATVLDESAEPLDAVIRPDRLALLFGSERHGLEREWIELCDRRVTLPMHGITDSLNLSVACGVFLYHFTR